MPTSKFASTSMLLLFAATVPYDDVAVLAALGNAETGVAHWREYVEMLDLESDPDTQTDEEGVRCYLLAFGGATFKKSSVPVLVAAVQSSEKVRRGIWRMGRAACNPGSTVETPEFMEQVGSFFYGLARASSPGSTFVKVPAEGTPPELQFVSPALRTKERAASAEKEKPSITAWTLDMAANDIRDAFLLAVSARYAQAITGFESLKLSDPTDSERSAGDHPNGILYALGNITGQHQYIVGDDVSNGPANAVTCKVGETSRDVIWNVDEKTGLPKDQSIKFALVFNPNRRASKDAARDALVRTGALVIAEPVKAEPATVGEASAPTE